MKDKVYHMILCHMTTSQQMFFCGVLFGYFPLVLHLLLIKFVSSNIYGISESIYDEASEEIGLRIGSIFI